MTNDRKRKYQCEGENELIFKKFKKEIIKNDKKRKYKIQEENQPICKKFKKELTIDNKRKYDQEEHERTFKKSKKEVVTNDKKRKYEYQLEERNPNKHLNCMENQTNESLKMETMKKEFSTKGKKKR